MKFTWIREDKSMLRSWLQDMLNSKHFREYSFRKLQEQEQQAIEVKQKLNEQLKAALEQKAIAVNPNVSKPKLTLKKKM